MMDEIKIKNFRASHPRSNLPTIRHVGREECETLQAALAIKLGMPEWSNALAILKTLEARASDISDVKPSEEAFVLSDLFERLKLEAKNIYINWSRFDDIDEMSALEFSAVFHDLWYLSSDDIEIFDQGQKWVLLIRHFDVVQILRI